MPLVEYAMLDESTYHKHQAEIDEAILSALADGPKQSYELMAMLRAKGFGNATDDGPLALSYSMTGAIYRSAKNSLRARKLIVDSWDIFDNTGRKIPPLQIMRTDRIVSEPPSPSKAEMLTHQEAAHG
jgi:hypothetical protein